MKNQFSTQNPYLLAIQNIEQFSRRVDEGAVLPRLLFQKTGSVYQVLECQHSLTPLSSP